MTRSWLRSVAYHVALVFALAFLASLLSAPAGIAHLSTLHAAALAGLGAAAAALYASLGQLQQGAKATARATARGARALARAAGKVAGLHTAADAAGIAAAGAQLHALRIGIYVQTSKAKTRHADVLAWLPALRHQAHVFAREWGLLTPQIILYVGKPSTAVSFDHLRLVILDDSDQANALGYHDEDATGPLARVFAVDCENNGVSVSSCVSHELLEAIADLACVRWAQAPDGRLFALEVCDPVESDTYVVDGVELSSYVLPSWFDPNGIRPFDVAGKLTAPFEVGAGGYGIVMTGGKVVEVYGDGSRRAYQRSNAWRLATKKSPLSRTRRRLSSR